MAGVGHFLQRNDPVMKPVLNEEAFLSLDGPLSIYSMAVVEPCNGPAIVLVATPHQLYQVAANEEGELKKKKVDTPCVPENGTMLAVAAYWDSFNGELHYAFTVIMDDGKENESYRLHVHHQNQRCEEIVLKTLPYHLSHSTVPSTLGDQLVWIVSGSEMTVVGSVYQSQSESATTDDDRASKSRSASTSSSTPVHTPRTSMSSPPPQGTKRASLVCESSTEGGLEQSQLDHQYMPLQLKSVLPEFANTKGKVLFVHTINTSDEKRRITTMTTEDCMLAIYDVDLKSSGESVVNVSSSIDSSLKKDASKDAEDKSNNGNNSTLASQASTEDSKELSSSVFEEYPTMYTAEVYGEEFIYFENICSSARFFVNHPQPLLYPSQLPRIPGVVDRAPSMKLLKYSLLMTNTVTESRFFLKPTSPNMTSVPLKNSNEHDSVLCSHICNYTGDNRMYCFLGTYGQAILVYKLGIDLQTSCYKSVFIAKVFAGAPVLSISSADISGDGIKSLVVLTSAGIQTFSLDAETTAKVLAKRLFKLLKMEAETPRAEELSSRPSFSDFL